MTTLTLPAAAVIRMFGATLPHTAKKHSASPVLEFVRVTVRDNLAVATATDRYTAVMHAENAEREDLEVLVSIDEAKAAIAAAKAVMPTAPVMVPAFRREDLSYPDLSRVVAGEGFEPGVGSKNGAPSFPAPSEVVKVDKTVRALKLKDNDIWTSHQPKTGVVRFDIGARTSVWLMPRTQTESSPVTIDWARACRP